MELGTFLNEKTIVSIKRKKGDVDISFEEISKWIENREFKSRRALGLAMTEELAPSIKVVSKGEEEAMINAGIISLDGKKIIGVKSGDKETIKTSTTSVKSLSKGKAKKLKIPQAKNESKYEDFLDTVIMNMMGSTQNSLLLTGDPGTGKCLEKDYMLEVEMSDEYLKLYEEFMKINPQ